MISTIELQLFKASASSIACSETKTLRQGDALIFKVDHALEHRVTPLTAGGPRIVWAGWFIGQ